MKRIGIILLGIVFFGISAPAQERKIEVAPFAGGYFSAGFQSVNRVGFGAIILGPGGAISASAPASFLREIKPVDEPNSGIFGVRASYDLSRRFTLEGTFGFSPAGRQFTPVFPGIIPLLAGAPGQPGPPGQGQFVFPNLEEFLRNRPSVVPFPLFPAVRGNDTFHYAGNVLFRWPGARGWTPFITGGLGAVTRTAEIVSPRRPITPYLALFPVPPSGGPSGGAIAPIAASIFIPAPIDTDLAVNFGGGVKKYLSSRCGIRFDFRDYVSKVDGDTVHNLEASLGVIFRF